MDSSKIYKENKKLDAHEVLADSLNPTDIYGLEDKLERPLGKIPGLFFLALIFLAVIYLVGRASSLQIYSGQAFFAKSEENRFWTRPVFAARGVINDKQNEPLVENVFSFGLIFEKDLFLNKKGGLDRLLKKLGQILDKDSSFFYGLGFPSDGDVKKIPGRIFIAQELSQETMMDLVIHLDELPGIQIFESQRRLYKSPYALSHLIGFVGRVSSEDLSLRPELSQEETVGKNGLEAFYDEILRGKSGRKIVEVNSRGVETRFKFTQEPEIGARLKLTIDGKLQNFVYDTLAKYIVGRKGASVVMLNPENGAVLSLVSYPSFDSNAFGRYLNQKEFEVLVANPLKPFFNRAISGEFPAASTIKPLLAAAALEEKIIDPNKKIYDEGFISIPNPYKQGEESIFLDWRKHGWVNLYDAIAVSANVYFYRLGGGYQDQTGLGIERIKKYATAFGLGSHLGIDLPGEKSGFIPDPESKKITEPENPIWRVGDTYNVSIGQGGVRVTPLQMSSVAAVIANGGKLYKPYLVDTIFAQDGEFTKQNSPELIRKNIVSSESLKHVIKGMRQTVTDGTARLLNSLPVEAAAKTGTAEAGSGLSHAWVIAFAPVDRPQIAMAVMVEHAGEGATVAVPIARDILQWYFSPR